MSGWDAVEVSRPGGCSHVALHRTLPAGVCPCDAGQLFNNGQHGLKVVKSRFVLRMEETQSAKTSRNPEDGKGMGGDQRCFQQVRQPDEVLDVSAKCRRPWVHGLSVKEAKQADVAVLQVDSRDGQGHMEAFTMSSRGRVVPSPICRRFDLRVLRGLEEVAEVLHKEDMFLCQASCAPKCSFGSPSMSHTFRSEHPNILVEVMMR